MQDAEIQWNGQRVALVLARTQGRGDHAGALIRVRYEAGATTTAFKDGKAAGTSQAMMFGAPQQVTIGDAEANLAAASCSIDQLYLTPRHNHNAIEPHAVTLYWRDGELFIHDSTQGVSYIANSMARIFGLDPAQVHVSSPYVGGAFGGKFLWQHHPLAAAASLLADRPVRLVLSREGVYRIVGGRAMTEQRVAIGAEADGRFTALIHTGTVAIGRHNQLAEPFIAPARTYYRADAFALDVRLVRLDMLANTFMRAPGEAVGSFALESAVDELADKLAIDPIELRLRNEPDRDPTSGRAFSIRNLAQAYRIGAERFGWQRRSPVPRARREGEWLVGMGCATGGYHYARLPGAAARITLTADNKATVAIAAHEMGMGTATVQSQHAADRLGLPLEAVTFRLGDTSLPGIVVAGTSQQTAAIGGAIIASQRQLVVELLRLAGNRSPLAGLDPSEVGCLDGGLASIADPSCRESYGAILDRAGLTDISVIGEPAMADEFFAWSMQSYSAMFCEVRVNAVTGETRVSRITGVFDCGRILNPKTAASQVRGGIIMGLGLALMEETLFDERNGRIMNPSLSEYHIPAHADVPEIDIAWTDVPDPQAPMGAHGVGEIGITGTAAAIANAVYNATGKRVRQTPITLDRLL
jgi:xanthine dehydrogenase YagR molybdenum-binding subunit